VTSPLLRPIRLTSPCTTVIGAFPWKFEGGEACPRRILAFLDVGPLTVEEVREAVGKKSG